MSERIGSQRIAWPNYSVIWRWHFYAGLFCLPFVLILSVTGTIYLFRPQIEAWQERAYDRLPLAKSTLGVSEMAVAAVAAVPGAKLVSVEALSEPPPIAGFRQATRVIVQRPGGSTVRVYVDPADARVLGSTVEDDRFIRVVRRIHGELLLGKRGSYLVELAASWTIVMVITGMALWMPRRLRLAGVVYPRLTASGKTFWKDVHSVGGFWVSGLVVVLIATGLPWSTFWGDYFKQVRQLTGTAVSHQHWEGGHGEGGHEEGGHERGAHKEPAVKPKESPWNTDAPEPDSYDIQPVGDVVRFARSLAWLPPVLVEPPSDASSVWKIRSTTPNRPHRQSLDYDVIDKRIIRRESFSSQHWVDRMVGQGIALHEGQRWNHYRFGWINQALAVLATGGLLMLSCTGVVLWVRRGRGVGLSPPGKPKAETADFRTEASIDRWRIAVVAVIAVLSIYLPLFGASVVLLCMADRLLSPLFVSALFCKKTFDDSNTR